MDWTPFYPMLAPPTDRHVDFLDIGCGYGGFLGGCGPVSLFSKVADDCVSRAVQLGEVFPERVSLGIEIRQKVSQFVADRIEALRA